MIDRGFETERTVLRAFEPDDIAAVEDYLNDSDIVGRRYLPWTLRDGIPLSTSQVAGILDEWVKQKAGFALAVETKASGRLIGHAVCEWGWDPHCPSASVVIAPSQQRMRYGSEVLSLLLRFLFLETAAHTVTGWVASWNEPALRFAAARGLAEAGRMPRAGLRDGAYYEQVVFDLLRREWAGREGGRHAA